jgi:hypothetical protein
LIILAVIFICYDFAGLLKRYGRVVVIASAYDMHKLGPVERFLCAIEIIFAGQIDGRALIAIEIYRNFTFESRRGPESPNAARALHFGKYESSVFLTNPVFLSITVAVSFPIYILASLFVITAVSVKLENCCVSSPFSGNCASLCKSVTILMIST